jgi:hypothetical protein
VIGERRFSFHARRRARGSERELEYGVVIEQREP